MNKQDSSNKSATKNMGIAFFLNLAFAITELIGGIITGSISIISDAIYDFGDCISLGTSWYLQRKSEKKANNQFTFGYKRFSLLGALLNASVLIFGAIYVFYEAGSRLLNPGETPNAKGMIWLAILGILVNGYAAFRLKKGEAGLNQKLLSWHLIEDVLGWVAVLIVSIVLMFKDIPILDPLLSIGITIYVLYHVIKNLKKTLMILLDSTPETIDIDEIKNKILGLEGAEDIHHLRVWSIDGEQHAFSAHVLVPGTGNKNSLIDLKEKIKEIVSEYDVTDITIQFDYKEEKIS
ncbi:cation transporter [Mesobacillus foraminis]|uniref:cation diffusion facilitator family transporter n=1 Tax=Mesobacillus foraminis TaxID=279826 RepID=UPI001BE62738|nr:cation diffusion facilitator family transporter [Mesobacillus foraminis]MBT2758782.1 cation transporter [Mesobacillus foraminis]